MLATPPPIESQSHLLSRQMAKATLVISPSGKTREFRACVTRITPLTLRLALDGSVAATAQELYSWNPIVDVLLELPRPAGHVSTCGKIAGVAFNFDPGSPSVVIDLDFPEITEDEEKVLRDSNPNLVVA